MTRRFAVIAVLLIAGLSAFATSAYMTDSAGQFGELNLTTGAFTPIGTQPVQISGMGFAPNGTMYASGFTLNSENGLFQVNPTTGGLTLLGTFTPGALGSTVGPNGLIYAVTFDLANSAFFTINPANVTTHIINSSLGFPSDGLAAFDNGQFYTGTANFPNDVLERIDPSTGKATAVGTGMGGFTAYAGATVGTTMYAVGLDSLGNSALFTLNTNTGVGSFVSQVTGLAADAYPFSLHTITRLFRSLAR